MSKERTVINQELCKKVKLMMAGGANGKEVAELLGIGETTVSRIRRAGFDMTQYNANTDRRRIMEKDRKADAAILAMQTWKPVETPELQGQIKMNLTAEEQKPEMSDQVKMMRFQAHQVDRMVEMLVTINTSIDKMNDKISMILRSIGSEKA